MTTSASAERAVKLTLRGDVGVCYASYVVLFVCLIFESGGQDMFDDTLGQGKLPWKRGLCPDVYALLAHSGYLRCSQSRKIDIESEPMMVHREDGLPVAMHLWDVGIREHGDIMIKEVYPGTDVCSRILLLGHSCQ